MVKQVVDRRWSIPVSGGNRSSTDAPLYALLSRALPTVASSGTAADAVSADYNAAWRSSGSSGWVAQDCSSLTSAQKATVFLAMSSDGTYGYDSSLGGTPLNMPGDYVVEGNAAAFSSGVPPSSGWTALVTTSGNTLKARGHAFSLTGFSSWRFRCTASNGSSGNSDVSCKLDLYDARNGIKSLIVFGDSIVANCFDHGNCGPAPCESLGNLMQVRTGINWPSTNGGVATFKVQDLLDNIDGWLASFVGSDVELSIGINDCGVFDSAFINKFESCVDKVTAAGFRAICPSIIWSPDTGRNDNAVTYNASIAAMIARKASPRVIAGPDLHGYFAAHPAFISDDDLHPTSAGDAAHRTLHATWGALNL